MVSNPKPRAATYADLLAVPEGYVAELVNGELFVLPRPKGRHAVAESALLTDINGRFGRRGGGWWILVEPECHLTRDERVLVPDVAGWRRERMPTPPEDHKFLVVPDWVCEVLSPSTQGRDWLLKLPLYLLHVRFAWVVDPFNRRVEAYRAEHEQWVLAAAAEGDVRASLPPFEEAELDLAEWWMPAPTP